MNKRERIKELKALIEEKKLLKKDAKRDADKFNAMQLALKLVLNGSYGAFANKHFVCFCNGVASTITAHGRDLTRTMNQVNEEYWYNHWHRDKNLHKKIAQFSAILDYIEFNDLDKDKLFDESEESNSKLEEIKKEIEYDNIQAPEVTSIDSTWLDVATGEVKESPTEQQIKNALVKRKNPVSVYADTDSLFVGFKPAIESYGWEHEALDFILFVSKERMQPYFKKKLAEYAEGFNVKNIQDFELEQISKSIIFLQKKMYVKNVVWDEGVLAEPETNLQAKGVDIVRSSSPIFTRENVPKILKYFFENPDTYSDRELVKLVRGLKDLFKLEPIENISMSSSCSNYDVKVKDDQDSLVVEKGTHHAVKAAALHNFLLNNNSQYKSKYNLIKSGQKVKYYYTTSKLNNEFAYMAGQYPKEIADKYAPIDIDKQFEKTILSIVNRFGEALGLSRLDSRLTFTLSLF
jgi:DNA polymerase elongation subunit (family B)